MPDPTPAKLDRVHTITCPLPPDANGECPLRFRRMQADEQLSQPFVYEVELLSELDDIDPNKLLGELMTVSVRMPDEKETRHFNGCVTQFSYQGRAEGY